VAVHLLILVLEVLVEVVVVVRVVITPQQYKVLMELLTQEVVVAVVTTVWLVGLE
jgi:hypothetical protein